MSSLAGRQRREKIEAAKRELMERTLVLKNPARWAEWRFPFRYWQLQKEIINSTLKKLFF